MNTRRALAFIFCTVALDVLASFLHRRRDHARGRAKAFGLVGMAIGLGFVVGPAFGWFVLPESLPPEKRMGFSWKRANPIGSLLPSCRARWSGRPSRVSPV